MCIRDRSFRGVWAGYWSKIGWFIHFVLTVFFIYTLHYIHSVQKGTIKLSLEGEGKEIVVKALAWESGIRLRIGEPSGSLGRGKGGGAWKNTFDAAVPPLTRYWNFNTPSSHHGCHRERIPKSIYCLWIRSNKIECMVIYFNSIANSTNTKGWGRLSGLYTG